MQNQFHTLCQAPPGANEPPILFLLDELEKYWNEEQPVLIKAWFEAVDVHLSPAPTAESTTAFMEFIKVVDDLTRMGKDTKKQTKKPKAPSSYGKDLMGLTASDAESYKRFFLHSKDNALGAFKNRISDRIMHVKTDFAAIKTVVSPLCKAPLPVGQEGVGYFNDKKCKEVCEGIRGEVVSNSGIVNTFPMHRHRFTSKIAHAEGNHSAMEVAIKMLVSTGKFCGYEFKQCAGDNGCDMKKGEKCTTVVPGNQLCITPNKKKQSKK